jgi:undecaprenyl-diphosphatase
VICASLWIRQRRRALPTLLTTVVAVALTDWIGFAVLKPLFGRERPCFALPAGTFRQLVHIGHAPSLPSLHAANAFAFAFAISVARPRWAPYLYFLATLIALSRVHVGVHWPSDLVGGAIWGTLVALLTHGLIRLAVHRRAPG